jgi:glycosyltransferase involved in cell wall biosynthesis
MTNRFIIITPAYNVSNWISLNLEITKHQSYKNFLHVVVNDKSTDGTLEEIQKHQHENLLVLSTPEGRGRSQGDTYLYAIEYLEANNLINDEDVIVEVDADDWLSSTFVLYYLDQAYKNKDVWMTYGQYVKYPTGEVGGHYQSEIWDQVDAANTHRQAPFPYSHLKTYKYWLLNKIDRNDLIDPRTNKVFASAWDHVLCLPMVEMAGKAHIQICRDILYVLNRSEDLQNESKISLDSQKQAEYLVRSKRPYQKLKR